MRLLQADSKNLRLWRDSRNLKIKEDASAEDIVQLLADMNRKLVADLAIALDLAGAADDPQSENLMIAQP
ncbi:MAG: hypothetical protein ACI9R3_001513 [Verrucomicrobiales bacterium]